jgi:hypothetical protein
MVVGTLLGTAVTTVATAQPREPLCVTTEVRRLVSAPYLLVNGSDHLVAQALPASTSTDAAFVVAVRDPDHSLRVGDARDLPRSLDEMEFERPCPPPDRDPGLTVLRLDRTLHLVGEPVFLPDPVRGERGTETYPPGIPAGATIDDGVLVVEHIAGDLYATVVPATGPVPAPRRVMQAPSPDPPGGHRGFVWLSMVGHPHEAQRGAALLAGTQDGRVMALTFDGRGVPLGQPLPWRQRVGGTMQLATVPNGPPVAILERPVRGTALDGSQAREQVLVRLTSTLEPLGDPQRLGLGPYPTTAVARGNDLVVSQWAEARALAVATLPVRDGQPIVELPRLWTTPPLEGIPLAHVTLRGVGNILYDLMLHGDDVAGGLHAYLTWLPPAGAPFPRRDVIPWRARMITRPALLPAEDGVVVLMAAYDELGGGIDAAHVRCELVTLPAR